MFKRKKLFSDFTEAHGIVFLSGIVGLVDGELADGGLEAEFNAAIERLERILEGTKLGLGDVVKITLFVRNMDNYQALNRLYRQWLSDLNLPPARSCIGVDLPIDANVELDVIASRPDLLTRFFRIFQSPPF